MRKVGSSGFESAQEHGDVLLARWETKGKAHWYELVERTSSNPHVGTHWDYRSNASAGGFTRSEGFDRRRAMCVIAKVVHNAQVIDKRNMQLVFDCSGVELPQFPQGVIVRHLESLPGVGRGFAVNMLVVKAEVLGIEPSDLDDLVHDVSSGKATVANNAALDAKGDAQRHDQAGRDAAEINNGGLREQITFLLDCGVTPGAIEQAMAEIHQSTAFDQAPAF
jgi:hypothetical protein